MAAIDSFSVAHENGQSQDKVFSTAKNVELRGF